MGWWCCCGGCTCCDTTNPCSTLRFSDCFTSSLAGYTDTGCGASVSFTASGGFLTETFNSPTYVGAGGTRGQAITIPTLNGLCISVSAQIYRVTGKTAGTTGIFIGSVGRINGGYSSPSPSPRSYSSTNGVDANGCVNGLGTQHNWGVLNTNFADGDCILLKLEDTSAGAGTYSLKSYLNGVLKDTYSGQAYALTAGNPISVGVSDTNGGQWSNLCISTS